MYHIVVGETNLKYELTILSGEQVVDGHNVLKLGLIFGREFLKVFKAGSMFFRLVCLV